MSTIAIYPPSTSRSSLPSGHQNAPSPLPKLLHTPAGLALIEIQGSINHPQTAAPGSQVIPIGRIEFPDYDPSDHVKGDGQGKWQKRVWLFIGDHQRMTGEVKKLPKPLGVLQRKTRHGADADTRMHEADAAPSEDLEITEIVKWKIVFGLRPEPVGVATEL